MLRNTGLGGLCSELQKILITSVLGGIIRLLSFEADFNKLIVLLIVAFLILYLKSHVYICIKDTFI
jgi:hypothetical protein